MIGLIKGDTRSLDYSSYPEFNLQSLRRINVDYTTV